MVQQNEIFADRYRLIRLIGRGGFAEVWLAQDVKTNVEVALKIYAPSGGMDYNGVKVFTSEYKLVCDLNHQNLLRPSFFDVCDNMPFLVMPYCAKGSCNNMTASITDDELWRLIGDVAGGLAYLHEQTPAVIHQDIKPDNILQNKNGDYLISDFGISTRIRSTLRKSVQQASSGGTMSYMSPERFGKDPLPVKASDIWSFGATLFEIVDGYPPFGEHGGLSQKNGAEIPTIKANISSHLKDLILNCLSVEPWDRVTAEALKEYAAQRKFKTGKTKTKNGTKIWMVLAVIVALIVVVFSFDRYQTRIKEEKAEQIRIEKAEQERLAKLKEARERDEYVAKYGPLKITNIEFSNRNNGDAIYDWGEDLKTSKMRYLHFRIYYNSLAEDDIKIQLFVKIIKPDGNIYKGDPSPINYTTFFDETIKGNFIQNEKLWLGGWGNGTTSSYPAGSYTVELYYQDTKIYSKAVRIYED